MHLYRTPLGDLVPGRFPIPSNPILLATAQATGITSLGELVNASFPLPQNPILAATSMDRPKVLTPADGKNALMRSLTAAKTGPVSSSVGMGDAASTLQSVGAVLDNTTNLAGYDVPYWVLTAAGVGLLLYMSGGKSGASRYQRLRGK